MTASAPPGLRLGLALLLAAAALEADAGNQWKEIGKVVGKASELRGELKIGRDNELKLGREVADLLVEKYGLYEGEELTRYVNLVGLAVARGAKREGIVYRFGILDTKAVNAYAAPGGWVFVTKGMLRRLKNEAQLAGVLAHEIVHVDRKHAMNAILKARALGEISKLALKRSEMKDVAQGLVEKVLEKGLPRADEYDADARAVPLAAAAGYRPSGLSVVLDEHFASKKDRDLLAALNSAHPSTESRLERLRKVLDKTPDEGAELPDRYKKRVRF